VRISMLFCRYREIGGEQISTSTEAQILRDAGHQVQIVTLDSFRGKLTDVRSFRPHIIHIQNSFPFMLPVSYKELAAISVPIVQSVRNYRFTCIAGTHWRAESECNACSLTNLSPAVVHGCYRGSRVQSLAATMIQISHRRKFTISKYITALIAVSPHVRAAVQDAYPDVPVFVKPNSVTATVPIREVRNRLAYIGRLSPEKGVLSLAQAWATDPSLPSLVVAGVGPEHSKLVALAEKSQNLHVIGALSHQESLRLLQSSLASLAPWKWSEPFGRTVVESLSVGTPVLGSTRVSDAFGTASGSIIQVDTTSANALQASISFVRENRAYLTHRAQEHFAAHFSPQANQRDLEAIYQFAFSRYNNETSQT